MAKSKKPVTPAAPAGEATEAPGPRKVDSKASSSLFGPGADNTVRGELVLKLSADAVSAATSSIPTGPLGALSRGIPSEFGLAEVDSVLKRFGPRSVSRMHPPRSAVSAITAEATTLANTFLVRIAEAADVVEAAQALSALKDVEMAEPNRWREASVMPNDPHVAEQWGLARINMPAAWRITTGSPSVIVGVVDTGVDLDHPELSALVLAGQDLVDLAGTSPPPGTHYEGDWSGRDGEPQDEVGHGTHVAGTIACVGNNAIGVAGVTWCSSILPVKVLTRVVDNAPPNRVHGVGSAVDIAAGIRWAVDHGARVLNLSLGGYNDSFVERDAIAYAVSRGVVVVAAMGNDDSTDTSYPAGYPGVIAVGATDQADQRAPFSNRGPHISVAAPGVGVLSTAWNDTYASMSGTSMACPHVAGVAALLLALRPELTADEVRSFILEAARPLREGAADPVPNDQFGAGLVDAAASLACALAASFPPPPTITRPTMPLPTLQTFPTRPTLTFPTRPTLPTFPTRPTLQTFPTRPTLTFPTRPTLPTFPTRPTVTFPTRPTAPTFPTRPTLTFPTRPTAPTFPTRPTLTFPTRPTAPTFPTRPTFQTRPTLTFPTRPTLTFPTRPTLTFPTRPTVIGPPIDFGGFDAGYDPYAASYAGYADPYAGSEYQGYEDPYAGYGAYEDPYGGAQASAYDDPYGYGATGYESYEDPYAAYDEPAYGDPYAASGYEAYDPYAGWGGNGDPSAGAGQEAYYDPYAGQEAYYDPYGNGAYY